MGVATDKLGVDAGHDIVDAEMTISAAYFGEQQDEVEEIAKFLADVFKILAIDGGEQFVEFGEKVLLEGGKGLPFIPWAAFFS